MNVIVLILILSGIYLLLSCAVIGAVLIAASKRIRRARKGEKLALQSAKHNQELLDAYGIKEITIKKEDD